MCISLHAPHLLQLLILSIYLPLVLPSSSLSLVFTVHFYCRLTFLCLVSAPRSNLSNNRITDIEEGTFEGASGVNELILTSNRLENIHHRMLKGLGGLRTLWVHTHSLT